MKSFSDFEGKSVEKALQQACEKLIADSGRNWTVEASLDRREVLAGTDYVINTIEVAGRENVRHDLYKRPIAALTHLVKSQPH